MGMVQSDHTRTITIENEPRPGPSVLVSEEVKKRIYKGFGKGDETDPPGPQSNLPKPASYHHTQIDETAFASSDPPPPTVNAKVLNNQHDLNYLGDHNNIQQILNKTNAIMEEEFHSSYAEVQDTFMTPRSSLWEPPCQDLKSKLFRCYSDNPGETLRCVGEVQAFSDCVNRSRVKQLDRKEDTYNLTGDIKI